MSLVDGLKFHVFTSTWGNANDLDMALCTLLQGFASVEWPPWL